MPYSGSPHHQTISPPTKSPPRIIYLKYLSKGQVSKRKLLYSQTSLIWTAKGQTVVSILDRCPYKRGHYDNMTFTTPLTVLSVK